MHHNPRAPVDAIRDAADPAWPGSVAFGVPGHQTACPLRLFPLERRVHFPKRWLAFFFLPGCLSPGNAPAQIDPVPRQLIQLGYNAALQGHPPFAGYAFYYWNRPDFYRTNLTLRLALAPTYLDSELGVQGILDAHTDLGIGVAGGGFADSYDEIRGGTFLRTESFNGHGGEVSLSLYHCFNPGSLIPLNGVLRGLAHYTVYDRRDETAPDFHLPEDQGIFAVRTGLRWGGQEPVLFPSLAMEISAWYEGRFRSQPGGYGFQNGGIYDRQVEPQTHLFWTQALLAYTLTNSGQAFYLNLTAGTSLDADRFSTYRLGALLPLVSEFPLSLPGYYYQEISARQFILLGGNYILPMDHRHRWSLNLALATAGVDYLPGLEQPGSWLSGVGAGILYTSSALKVMVGYGYGVDAIRSSGRGAHSIGILMQIDLERARTILNPEEPGRWRGFQRIMGVLWE